MTAEQRVEALAGPIRTAVAGMALAVGLLLLFRVPLITTFRIAVIALAAVELLEFGAAAVSRPVGPRDVLVVGVKLIVLGAAYLALSS